MIDQAVIAAAKMAMLGGELAIVPTDTVYGLAAALDAPDGIDAMYSLKSRPRSQPCQVLVYTRQLLEQAIEPLESRTASAVRLLLPGQVTCLVPDPADRYAAAAGDQRGTVGLRAPLMEGAILGLDIALVATSANEPGEPPPATLPQVPERLRTAERMVVLDIGTLSGTASTVVDLLRVGTGGAARIVRPGSDVPLVVQRLSELGIALDG